MLLDVTEERCSVVVVCSAVRSVRCGAVFCQFID